jgi:exonuclease SbcD
LGKVLKGVSRLSEQELVLAELVEIAERERVDVVLVAGDVFESAAPSADAQRLAWTTLLALRRHAQVLVVAGNHDHADGFDALSPVLAAAGVHIIGRPRRPDGGGVVTFEIGDEPLCVGLLPFVSQRGVVRAADLLDLEAAEMSQTYSERLGRLVGALSAQFDERAVNVMLIHAMVRGAKLGGGERDAQTVFAYGIDTTVFDPATTYVALGHLHRQQQLPGPCPIWYSGSPICVDFGEDRNRPGILVVEAHPGLPAAVRQVTLQSTRGLVTIRDTLDGLRETAPSLGDDLVKVILTEPARAGLAEEVRAIVPNAIDIRIERALADGADRPTEASRLGGAPHAQFATYLREQGIDDHRVTALFHELLDQELAHRRRETTSDHPL